MMSLNLGDDWQVQQLLIECQGSYQGYFMYDEKKVQEKFQIILQRHNKPGFAVVGFGQNEEMGSFLL